MPDAEKDAGRIDALRIESDDGTLTFATRHDGQIEAQSDGLVVMDGATAIRLVEWLTDRAAGKGVGACGRTFQHDPHRYLDAQGGTRVRLCDGNGRVLPPAVGRVCPECQQGKHQNCDGTAWDDVADAPGPCSCTDGSHR